MICVQTQQAVLLYFSLDLKLKQSQTEKTPQVFNAPSHKKRNEFPLPVVEAEIEVESDKLPQPQCQTQSYKNQSFVNHLYPIGISKVVYNKLDDVTEPQTNYAELKQTGANWVTV